MFQPLRFYKHLPLYPEIEENGEKKVKVYKPNHRPSLQETSINLRVNHDCLKAEEITFMILWKRPQIKALHDWTRPATNIKPLPIRDVSSRAELDGWIPVPKAHAHP